MEFASYEICYRADGMLRELSHEGLGGFETDELELSVSFDGEQLRARLRAHEPLRVERLRVVLRHDPRRDERWLLNGWQSWTETRWLSARERMHGLERVPRALVDRFVLDGSGDYRFCPHDPRPGRFHGWTFAELERGEDGAGGRELVASADESHGFTLVRVDAGAGRVALETESPQRELQPGDEVPLADYVLLCDADRGRLYDRWFSLMGVRARQAPPLVGYSSWYRRYAAIDERALAEDLAAARHAIARLELGNCAPVFQVDDGWCKVGDWLEPDAGKFPHGMAGLAARIRGPESEISEKMYVFFGCAGKSEHPESTRPGVLPFRYSGEPGNRPRNLYSTAKNVQKSGNHRPCAPGEASDWPEPALLPGLWLAPFVCERDSRVFHQHPGWLLRDEAGAPVRTGGHWSGGYALDTLNPRVRDYVRDVIRTATREWGFRFLKLDFLYSACMIPHGGMNRGELMADAIDLLRESAGDGVLLDGCGVPLASAFGKLDYCRVGCDVGLDWNGAPPMRLLERERVSTRNSLACTLARAPLDGRAFGCDPDVVFLRRDVRLSDEQKANLLEAAATRASMLLTSDDMAAWDADRLASFQGAVSRLSARKGNA